MISKDDTIKMARESGFAKFLKPESRPEMICGPDEIERFAQAIYAQAIDDAAKVSEDILCGDFTELPSAIRALAKEKQS